MAKIWSFFRNLKHVNVSIWPRSMIDQVYGKPSYPYAFRAVSRNNEAILFVDKTETPDSIAWLLAHELAHHLIFSKPSWREELLKKRPAHLDPSGDAFHALDPEELAADDIATKILGTRFNRAWWRRRT
jgi:hypothetical protein